MLNEIPFEETPHGHTFLQLFRVAHRERRYPEGAWSFALVWMAVARLAVAGRLPAGLEFEDFRTAKGWERFRQEGPLPMALVGMAEEPVRSYAFKMDSLASRSVDDVEAAWRIVSDALGAGMPEPWDLADAFWYAGHTDGREGRGLAPSLADTLVALLGDVRDKTVWCPYDRYGQLAVRLLRAGATVFTADPDALPALHLLVLRELDSTGQAWRLRMEQEAVLREDQADIDLALCASPAGLPAKPWEGWAKRALAGASDAASVAWLSTASQTLRLDRLESASVWLMWARVKERAVFLVAPSLLHARGQEQQLREHLIRDECIDSIVSLPPRLVGGSPQPVAVLVLDRRPRSGRGIRMVEAIGSRFIGRDLRSDAQINAPGELVALANRLQSDPLAVDVPIDEIPPHESNLTPARHLLRMAREPVGGDLLGDLVEVLRPPPKGTVRDAVQAREVGIPGLDTWGFVPYPVKVLDVRASKLRACQLQAGDLVFAIKGSVGKVGLVGPDVLENDRQAGDKLPWVVSQSCIGLRLRPGAGISPVYLYMFLRSERGRELIDALRVGAVIPHVTPVALLEEIRVPRPSPAELKRAEKVFQSLRRIEAEIAAKLLERDRSAKTLWPIPKDETDRGPQPKSADDE